MSKTLFKIWPFSRIRNWQTVAFDTGFAVSDGDGGRLNFHLQFDKCFNTGKRRVVCLKKPAAWIKLENHDSASNISKRWEHSGELYLTTDAAVFDNNYKRVMTSSHFEKWEYHPIGDMEQAIKHLKNHPEMRELCKHQMVEDAFKQLETVIAMHENIDAKSEEV